MKKRILTLGVVLVLAAVLAVPGAVFATDGSAAVTGNVVEGYTFTPPSAIALGTMTPGTPATGDSSGWLEGNNALGYKVTGVDEKGTDTGYMVSGGRLQNKLNMGDTGAVPNNADVVTTFLTTSTITNEAVPFYVSQLVAYTDAVATGYTITITFTVTQNT